MIQTTLAPSLEHDLAIVAVRLLRAHLVSDDDILTHFTTPDDADAHYETAYLRDHGVAISATTIKAHMRRLVTH